jgi:hypothetical protein
MDMVSRMGGTNSMVADGIALWPWVKRGPMPQVLTDSHCSVPRSRFGPAPTLGTYDFIPHPTNMVPNHVQQQHVHLNINYL